MHDLIVAFLEFAINVDVLDVETSQELEDLIGLPFRDILDSSLVFLSGQMLNLDLSYCKRRS